MLKSCAQMSFHQSGLGMRVTFAVFLFQPLYKTVPVACSKDPLLYEYLALLDASPQRPSARAEHS